LRDRPWCVIEHIRERAAVTDDRIELAVRELREVDDVANDAILDRVFESRISDVLCVQCELPRRDICSDHLCPDLRELDREPARPAADVEYAVSWRDEPTEIVDVGRGRRARGAAVFEPRPLAL